MLVSAKHHAHLDSVVGAAIDERLFILRGCVSRESVVEHQRALQRRGCGDGHGFLDAGGGEDQERPAVQEILGARGMTDGPDCPERR